MLGVLLPFRRGGSGTAERRRGRPAAGFARSAAGSLFQKLREGGVGRTDLKKEEARFCSRSPGLPAPGCRDSPEGWSHLPVGPGPPPLGSPSPPRGPSVCSRGCLCLLNLRKQTEPTKQPTDQPREGSHPEASAPAPCSPAWLWLENSRHQPEFRLPNRALTVPSRRFGVRWK